MFGWYIYNLVCPIHRVQMSALVAGAAKFTMKSMQWTSTLEHEIVHKFPSSLLQARSGSKSADANR